MLSGRLVALRTMEMHDLDFLSDLANHPLVRGNVVGWEWPVSRDGQAEWYQKVKNNPHTKRLIVTLRGSHDPIGLTGLWDVDWHNQSALTAVKLMPGVTPKGAGTDSIMLMMAWAFYDVGLRRLYGSILDFNQASIGAYVRRCGWQVEGRSREAVFRGGEWRDLLQVAALKSDFDGLQDSSDYIQYICPVQIPRERDIPTQLQPAIEVQAVT